MTAAASKRSPTFGMVPDLAETCQPEISLEIFRRMCLTRCFEEEAFRATKEGSIKALVYLSSGQEAIAAAVSTVMQGSYVFAQHRGHSVYLSFGGNIPRLIDELLGLPSGCCRGMGGSPCIQDREMKIVGHEGLISEHVPIAVGMALGSGERVSCFFGDGAVEEDYFYPALGFAATRKLPVLFVCEDNDLSVLTPTKDRRTWEIADVARSFGVPAVDITDDPWLIRHHVLEMSRNLPGLVNCRTARLYWHVGAGRDSAPEWDRMALVRAKLHSLGLGGSAQKIELETQERIVSLWKERLPTRSVK